MRRRSLDRRNAGRPPKPGSITSPKRLFPNASSDRLFYQHAGCPEHRRLLPERHPQVALADAGAADRQRRRRRRLEGAGCARPAEGGSLRRSSSALRFTDRLLALASARINGFARPGSIDRLGDVGATLPAMKDVRQPVAWTRVVGKMCLQGDYDWSFDER